MSKERARRRAARQERQQAEREARARLAARRARRAALVRRLTPRLPDRRVGKLYPRRTRAQRTLIIVAFLIATVLIWHFVDGLGARLALIATLAVATPAIVVIAFGRR